MVGLQAAVGALALTLGVSAPLYAQEDKEQTARELTVIGCVELERDYRARKDAGRGGALGSGVGVGNEFVLTDARLVTGRRRGGAAATAEAPATDYSLTGRRERDLLRAVGRQIEVVGILEDDDADGLPVINISLWHPVADFCPAR